MTFFSLILALVLEQLRPLPARGWTVRGVRGVVGNIQKMLGKIAQKGYTIVPVEVYFKGSLVKVQVALAKGKKQYDKRQSLREKDDKRDMDRMFKK